jgi:hypothetical protein
MLEVAARMAPSQPNEAMARIAPRSPMVNNEILLDPSSVLWDRFEILLGGSNRFEKRIGLKRS